MKVLKYGRLVFLLLFCVGAAQAQEVDLLTGRAQVSIPLWELNYGGVSVPISIWHHGSSLKVEEGEGDCGMGWNLSAGGAVSRMVRGLPDDYTATGDPRRGWLFDGNAQTITNFSSTSNDDLSNCSDEANDYDFISALSYTKDPEPDIFYFNAPGLSGQFVFGVDGNPKLLSYQDLKFTVAKDADGRIIYFIIQTNTGISYNFNTSEEVFRKTQKSTPNSVDYFQSDYNYYLVEARYTTSWRLGSITSAATGLSVNFSYSSKDEVVSNNFVSSIGTSTNKQDTLYYLRDRILSSQLNSVTGGPHKVTFAWGSGMMNSMTVTTTGFIWSTESKGFDFVYHGVKSSTDTSNPPLLRYFLKEVTERNSCQPFPSYAFEYESVFMTGSTAVFPWETRLKQDYWGHFNANSTNKNVPHVFYYSGESDERRLRVDEISGGSPTTTMQGDTRSVGSTSATYAFGALKSIVYPRGGETVYTYENNTYYDASDNSIRTGPGIRVSRVSTYAGEVAYGKNPTDHLDTHAIQKDYEYALPGGTTSGLITYPAVFAFATGTQWIRSDHTIGSIPEVLYSRVKEKLRGKGNSVFEFDLPNMYPDPTAIRSKIARSSPCGSVGNQKNGRYSFPFAPTTNVERGLLKKQTDYDSTGIMVRQRRLSYSTISPANLWVYGLRFERIANGFHFSKYTVITGNAKVLSQEVSVAIGEENTADSTKSTLAYFYNGNYMLDSIKTTNDDGSIVSEKIKYAKDFNTITSPSGGDIPSNAIKQLNATNRHGEVIERTRRIIPIGGSSKVIGSSLILYKIFDTRTLPYQYLSFPQLPAGFTKAKVTGQAFEFNSNYVINRTIDEYDIQSNVVAESDKYKNSVGYWTRDGNALPPGAVVTNAKRNQSAYESFDWFTGPGFTGGSSLETGRTGRVSRGLTNGGTPLLSAVIEKNGNKYRVSCWVKASQASTVTFKAKNGGSAVSGSTIPLSYNPPTLGTWVYLEGVMDVTNAPTSFQTELSSSAAVWVDDIVSIPIKARIAMNSITPLIGMTSKTDDRGNTETFTYDNSGKLINTFDRKQNLIQTNQHLVTRPFGSPRSPGFKSSSAFSHKVGQESKFSALTNECITFGYAWTIYDRFGNSVATSSDSTITWTFASPGQHNIKLTLSSSIYGSRTFEEVICVAYPDFQTPTLRLIGNTSLVTHRCNDLQRIFLIVQPVRPPFSNQYRTVSFQWSIKRNSTQYWEVIAGNTSTLDFTSPLESYAITCTVTFSYISGNIVRDKSCYAEAPTSGEGGLYLTYVNDAPCQ